MTFHVFNSNSAIGFHNMEHVNTILLLRLNVLVSADVNMSSVVPILMPQHVFKPVQTSLVRCVVVWSLAAVQATSSDLLTSLSATILRGSGKIPPESTLTFIIEVMEIRNGPRSHESFQEMDLNDDWKLSKYEVMAALCCLSSPWILTRLNPSVISWLDVKMAGIWKPALEEWTK